MAKGKGKILFQVILPIGLALATITIPKVFPMDKVAVFFGGALTAMLIVDVIIKRIIRKGNLSEKSLDYINFIAVFSARVEVAGIVCLSLLIWAIVHVLFP